MEFLRIEKPQLNKKQFEKASDMMFNPVTAGEISDYIKRT
jgi:hypothetical protein